MNKLIASGRTGKQPEIHTFENGNTKVSFSLAVNERFKKKYHIEYTEKTDWLNCIAYGNTATFIEKHVKQGDRLSIIGKLRQRTWQDKDGNNRHTMEVEVNEVEKWDWEKKDETAPSNNAQSEPDDLPF